MLRKEKNKLSVHKRLTGLAALCLGLLLTMTSSSAFASQEVLVNSLRFMGNNCFSLDAQLVGFTSAEYGDLQFIIFLVDPYTGQTAQTAVPDMTELNRKGLRFFPTVNRLSHDMTITGCVSELTLSEDLEIIVTVFNETTGEAAAAAEPVINDPVVDPVVDDDDDKVVDDDDDDDDDKKKKRKKKRKKRKKRKREKRQK